MKLYITLGNAAFEDGNKSYEVARILDEAARVIADGRHSTFPLRDVNGNTVGAAAVEGDIKPPVGEDFVAIDMDTGNAAFEDMGLGEEVARILQEVADKIRDDGNLNRPLRDYNGNKVGAIAETIRPAARATLAQANRPARDDDAPSP